MKFNSDEIASVIAAEIEKFGDQIDVREVALFWKSVTGSPVYTVFPTSCPARWSSSLTVHRPRVQLRRELRRYHHLG